VHRFIIVPMSGTRQIVPAKTQKQQERSGRERPCRVYVHNDDVTPMDFVVHVLATVFLIPSPNSEHIMFTAHLNGRCYVQTLPEDEARRRIGKAHFAARLRGLPLEFSLEME
jgi:ATP-dependent Clp protease adaptor protein ClpS